MRIGPDLDRMIAAMKQWLDAEKRYWQVWNEAETKRVEGERNTLAGMQEDQKSVAVQIEDEKKNQEALERSRADLENSKRTEEIKAEMDRLLKDIQDSQARLDHAREQYNSLSVSITDYQSLLNTRIVNIRQNIQRLDAYEVDQNATYESERKAAQEVCNMKQPSSPTPLPKSGGK
jgi:chromosome segregation ATPase